MRAHQWTALLGAAAMAVTVAGCERYEHHDGDRHHGKADVGAVKDAIAADEK